MAYTPISLPLSVNIQDLDNANPGLTGSTAYTKFSVSTGGGLNLANIKATPGKVTGWYIYNSATTPRKIMLYDKATTPLSTDTPIINLVIPATGGANCPFPSGLNFQYGIGVGMSADITSAAPTAVADNDIILNIYYK